MKTRNEKLQPSLMSLGVQGALAAMFAVPMMAMAADDEVSVLTRPTSSIEVGVAGVSEKSAKFGEYNGLNDSGAFGIGNFNIGGGSAYDAYDGGSGSNSGPSRTRATTTPTAPAVAAQKRATVMGALAAMV